MSWLTDAIEIVRDVTNEPSLTGASGAPKYPPAKITAWLERSWATIVPNLFLNASSPITLFFDLTVVTDQTDYAKPPHVAEIMQIAKVDGNGNVEWVIEPRSRWNPGGPIVDFDGMNIRWTPTPRRGETFRIWYVPTGEIRLVDGPVKTGSTVSAITADTATNGSFDKRDNAYAGYTCRVTATNGQVEDRMINSSTFDGTDHVFTVKPDYSITVTGGTFDLVPINGDAVQFAVSIQTGLHILRFEGNARRIRTTQDSFRQVMRELRMKFANMENIVGQRFRADIAGNDNFTGGGGIW